MRWLKLAIALGTLLVLGLASTPVGHDLIALAGNRLPKQDVSSDYALGLAWAVALGLSLFMWPVDPRTKQSLLWLWAAKVVTALGLMLVYEGSYGLDAFAYYVAGQPGFYDGHGLAYGNGTEIVQWLSHLHWQWLVADSYHAMKMSFAYVGFIGCFFFYRAATLAFMRNDLRLLWLIVLVPSVLQWSTILGKDPIAFCGIGIYCLGVVRMQRLGALRAVPVITAGIALAAATRPWLALILLAPLTSFAWLSVRRPAVKALLLLVSIAGFAVALALFSDRLQIASVDDAVERTELISQSFARGGSANTSDLAEGNTPEKMLRFAPIGAFSALFRPLPGEVGNLFGLLAGLENLALLALAIIALRRTRFADFKEPLVLWASSLVLVWSFVYGFVSFHNMGSGARFRLQIMPVFVCLLLYMARVLQRRLHAEELRRRVLHRAHRVHGTDATGADARVQSRRALSPRGPKRQ